MKTMVSVVLCAMCVWIVGACGTAEAGPGRFTQTTRTLTVNKYVAPRVSHNQHSGSHYSPVKFQPRRYTWQRNLGKLEGYMLAPKPHRGTYRNRERFVVRGATTRRREVRRFGIVRRRESRSERIRTRWGGFGTHN
jgi:hypothetical protein